MKPRPLLRSITFGSGILVMTFLCWAWWDSMKVVSRGNAARLSVSSYAGGLELADTRIHRGWHGQRSALASPRPPELFPAPFHVRGKGPAFNSWAWSARSEEANYVDQASWRAMFLTPGSVTIFVPYWLLLLVMLPPWSGFLLWRSRRIRRSALTLPP